MPTVEKVSGGRVYIRPLDQDFTVGDTAEVTDSEVLDHLTETRGDFRVVDAPEAADSGDEPPDDEDDEDVDGEDTETCDVVKSDGEVCGRELPCPYHSDEDDEEE